MLDKRAVTKAISEQLHRMLVAKQQQAEVLQHNLEKGLGNEQALRELLSWFLPRRFGVAKGKIINGAGEMSRQLDAILYDANRCPTLFLDEHRNQILPIEGVYGVVEVKTTLTNTILADAFEHLASVARLAPRRDASTNARIAYCPPALEILAFDDARSLTSIAEQFDRLSTSFPVDRSFSSYSEKSPIFKTHTRRTFLVHSVYVLGKGCVLHLLDGTVELYDWGEHTLAMFVTQLVRVFDKVELPSLAITDYLNWIMVDEWRGGHKLKQLQWPAIPTEP